LQLQLQEHRLPVIVRRMSAEISRAELRDAIRVAGIRATASRVAVLRELRGASKPVSHAEVVAALAEEPWDRATLYRNLIDLVNAGLARKVELGDRVWRFDGAVATKRHDATLHPHFVCTLCGAIECLPEVAISPSFAGKLPKAVLAREVEVHVRGVCDTCGPDTAAHASAE
jgi:Fur family transcriptional regulator, ferric uptake regulator